MPHAGYSREWTRENIKWEGECGVGSGGSGERA